MSLNVDPINVQKVLDPRLIIGNSNPYIISKGAVVNSWQSFNNNNPSNSSINITCNPPSRDTAICRLVYKRVLFNFTVTGTNTSGGNLLNDGYYGPRAMPLTCVTESENIKIVNDNVTQAPIQSYWRALLRYRNDFENRFGEFSLAPSMLDQYQTYSEGVGTNRNPLATYGDNSYEQTRFSYVGFQLDPQVINPSSGVIDTVTGTLETVEPILVSPFVFGDKGNFYSSFTGIDSMTYVATLGNLSRILSLVQDQGLAGQILLNTPVVNVASATLLFNYLSPDPIYPVPRSMSTSYFSIVSYPTRYTSGPVAPNQTVNISMSAIQVSSIPKRIYVFAKRDDAFETAFTTDTFLSFPRQGNPLRITWNNRQFLSSASTEDLYNISVKNGCNLSYTQYTNTIGSVLALDFGIDIGLESNQSAGVIGNYQLNLQADFTNTNQTDTFNATMYVIVVYEGVFSVVNGSVSHMVGVVSPTDVLDAPISGTINYRDNEDVYGGRIWDKIKNAAIGAHKFAKKHKLVSRGLSLIPTPNAQMASKAAEAFGYGMSGGMEGYGMSGGKLDNNNKCNKDYKDNKNVINLSDF